MRLAAALIAALTLAAPASAERKETAMVPVTAPDENGQAVSIDTDVRLPDGAAPKRGWPVVALFHGGGGTKSGEFDSNAASAFTAHGYATILYSARGHGASGGQTTVVGPKEIRDVFDVLGWAIAKYGLDRRRIALWGYSQGGLHTNLAQAWSRDRDLNPKRLRFAALMPSSTPDKVFDALIEHQVVKLSFGLALTALYSTSARPAPQVDRWIATAAADQPAAYGAGGICDTAGHDTATSPIKADLAWRSMGCRPKRLGLPTFWLQQFDDGLFPVHMAVRTMRVRRHRFDRLTLGTGGHAAPTAAKANAADALRRQIAWLGAVLHHRRPPGPRVVYYARDPAVAVPYAVPQWPDKAWVRRTARRWPPRGVRVRRVDVPTTTLTGLAADPQHDSAATAAGGAIPSGTTITGALPALETPGAAAEIRAPALTGALAGRPVLRGTWTPLSPDTQVTLQLLDEAPDGTLTLLSRGVRGIRGAIPGQPLTITVPGTSIAALLRPGHRLLLRLGAADASFYKPFPGSAGGTLDDAVLRLPLLRR
jgi:ABC-2 type transport system ATP-binding protein